MRIEKLLRRLLGMERNVPSIEELQADPRWNETRSAFIGFVREQTKGLDAKEPDGGLLARTNTLMLKLAENFYKNLCEHPEHHTADHFFWKVNHDRRIEEDKLKAVLAILRALKGDDAGEAKEPSPIPYEGR